jgi:hypothetical protein
MVHSPSKRKYEDNKQIKRSAHCCAEQDALEGGNVVCVVVAHLMIPPLLLSAVARIFLCVLALQIRQ